MTVVFGIAGLVVIFAGLVLVGVGVLLAWREETSRREEFRGVGEVAKGLAALADALAKHPVSIRLIFLGIVLIVVGGTMGGVSSIAA